jgi:predicted RNase H-like HicB family nuclease
MMHYPIAIEPCDAEHAYGVVVPDLPGCFSAGDTLDEAIANAPEAIALWMEDLVERGEVAPGA